MYVINEHIKVNQVRVILDDKNEVMATKNALKLAQEQGLDLILIFQNANPPVCKIADYNKLLYEMRKKEKAKKKNQKTYDVKEIRLSLNIEENDLLTKTKNARKILLSSNKIKVIMRLRGREITRLDKGKQVLNRFFDELSDICRIEKDIKVEGNNLSMILTPTN